MLEECGTTPLAVKYTALPEHEQVVCQRSESRNILVSRCIERVTRLQLPERDERSQDVMGEAVKHWMAFGTMTTFHRMQVCLLLMTVYKESEHMR